MPTFQASPDAQLHYLVDDFTDPWRDPETILLLHGNAESGAAWYGWVPLSRAAFASCARTCAALAPRRRCRATFRGRSTSSSTISCG